MNDIRALEGISQEDINEVGGKAASLGEMLQNGFPVPPGFVITTNVFQQFFGKEISPEIVEKILKFFTKLNVKEVIVRSSAVAEDSSTSSWAGQLESYLNVTKGSLIEAINRCWSSIKNEKAQSYAGTHNIPNNELAVAVVIQKLIDSQVSGVMFTVNPITGNQSEIMVEAVRGLGEALVQGTVTPDNYLLEKETLKIKERQIEDIEAILDDKQLNELSKLALKIEDHFSKPQDIEWGIDESGKIWILQSRPVTA